MAPMHPGGGEVEQGQALRIDPLAQVPSRQGGLDRALALTEPVHGGIDLVGANVNQSEVVEQGGIGPPLGGGELGAGMDHPGENEGIGDIALFALRTEQLLEPQRLGHSGNRRQMPVGKRAQDLHPFSRHHQRLARQGGAQGFERGLGKSRDVAEGFVADLAILAIAAAQQVGDRLAALSVLGLVLAYDPGDMNRACLPSRKGIVAHPCREQKYYLGYTSPCQNVPMRCSTVRSHGKSGVTSIGILGYRHGMIGLRHPVPYKGSTGGYLQVKLERRIEPKCGGRLFIV